jgi:hypothetical protein
MALELNGTTGVSLVQDGVVTAADLASTLDLTGKTVTLPAGVGGKVLQVVSATKTDTSVSTSTTLADVSGLSVNITPSSTSSKILVLATVQGSARSGWNNMGIVLVRGSTSLCIGDVAGSRARDSIYMPGMANDGVIQSGSINYLDSPSTTSSTTYKIQFRVDQDNPGQGVYINRSWSDPDSGGMGRVASTITVMEIAA